MASRVQLCGLEGPVPGNQSHRDAEMVIALTPLVWKPAHEELPMKTIALGFAVVLSMACSFVSSAESLTIYKELLVQGKKASEDAHEMMQRNRPESAAWIMTQHVNAVDDLIEKVNKDSAINARHKDGLLQMLRKYRTAVRADADRMRAVASFDMPSRFR